MAVFRRWPEDTTLEMFLADAMPVVEREGYRLNTDEEFVEMVYEGLFDNLESRGDMFCPCRMETGDIREDGKVICPCIPNHRELFARIGKCWCGLFVRKDIENDEDLFGVVDDEETADEPLKLPVISLDYFPVGSMRTIPLGKQEVTVVRLAEDDIRAAYGLCTHMGESFADGFVIDEKLVCPLHGWQFDLKDGTTNHPGKSLTMYDVVVEDGVVYVLVD